MANPQLWLPPRYTYFGPYPQPRDEREALLQELHELRVMVPGGHDFELSYLRDLVAWQRQKRGEDAEKAAKRPANIESGIPKEQVITGIKEWLAYRKRREAGLRRHYLSAAGFEVPM